MATTASEFGLVDPATSPYLSGRFAPIHREISTANVAVEGDVPDDLIGTYIRNGPNPKFTPLGSYSYPIEGDGMLHAVSFGPDTVRYQNRWVRTRGLEAEERAGRALFGGIMTPAFVDPALLGPDPDLGWPTKLDAFINVVAHGGRYLALEEGLPAYEVSSELETVGRYDFEGGLPKGMTAHPKFDPLTGELVVFRYDIEAPFLTWAIVAADGSMAQPETMVDGVDHGFMIHDFAITPRYLVVSIGPAVFDIDAMLAGGPMLSWQPDLGMRIAVIPREGSGPVRWIETDAYWVWHYANAFESGDTIAMDFPHWNVPGFLAPDTTVTGAYVRAILDPAAGSIEFETVQDEMTEFPRIDERRRGCPHRYVIATASTGSVPLAPGEHDALCRIDLETGTMAEFPTGGAIGEAIFAPKPGGTGELDGYYLAFVNALDGDHTTFNIWDAAAFPGTPRSRIHLPQRVPNGLHGNWFPAT